MPSKQYDDLVARGFGEPVMVLCHESWTVPMQQCKKDPSEIRVAQEAKALARKPWSDRVEDIVRLAHGWPKLLAKVMTKLHQDQLENARIGKKAGNRKTAKEVEVVDADVPAVATEVAECEAEYRAWESALRENKGHKTVYPFVIPLVDGELV
jgi:hypothetical protein